MGLNDIETVNDYALHAGKNLPNHSMSLSGYPAYVTQGLSSIPLFRTKDDLFRYAAWLITLADFLPYAKDGPTPTFEDVLNAVHNT